MQIIKPLWTASFKTIYPKVFTSGRVRGICLFNKSYFSVIDKTTVATCLEASKNASLFMLFTFQTFRIVILVIVTPIPEFVISFTVNLHTTYLTQQEVDQTFIATCKSMIDFVNLFVNKQLKCVSFYNNFANLPTHFLTFP